jgi:hypothetical protein
MTEHFLIVGKSVDELDSGKDVTALVGKKLKDSAMLATNDHTTINKRKGGRRIVTTDSRRPESPPVASIPKAESRIIGDCGDSNVSNVKLESNERLRRHLNQSTQTKRKS